MTTEELVAQNIAAIPVSEPSIRAKSAPRLYVVLLFGSLIGALLGAQNLETWVEDAEWDGPVQTFDSAAGRPTTRRRRSASMTGAPAGATSG